MDVSRHKDTFREAIRTADRVLGLKEEAPPTY
jgi:hypothetical protein